MVSTEEEEENRRRRRTGHRCHCLQHDQAPKNSGSMTPVTQGLHSELCVFSYHLELLKSRVFSIMYI